MASAFYRFKNCSSKTIYVYWKSPRKLKYYNCLAPGEFLDVNTCVHHKWVFLNVRTGSRLWAGGCFEFEAKSWKEELETGKKSGLVDPNHDNDTPIRTLVKLSNPMNNLKYLAMEVILDTIDDTSIRNSLDTLEIPNTLREDLLLMAKKRLCVQTHYRECNCFNYLYLTRDYLF